MKIRFGDSQVRHRLTSSSYYSYAEQWQIRRNGVPPDIREQAKSLNLNEK
ncbi:hypothetical protein [Bacillus sp. FJAT-42376]|nr:hypothetical protein [Bacillus sp. FJAT-42376]